MKRKKKGINYGKNPGFAPEYSGAGFHDKMSKKKMRQKRKKDIREARNNEDA